jgi:glycerol uptake facilitator-like aquaporin
MDKFWELFRESVVTTSVITLVLVVTVCIMFVRAQPIPELLAGLLVLVVGWWFGAKVGPAVNKAVKK